MAEGRAAEGRPRVGGWGRHVRHTTCRRGGKVEKRQGSPAGSPSGAAAECCALLAREGAWAARGAQGRRGDEAGTGPAPGQAAGAGTAAEQLGRGAGALSTCLQVCLLEAPQGGHLRESLGGGGTQGASARGGAERRT